MDRKTISLEACAERRNLNYQKQDTLKEYYKKGYNTNEIPLQELLFYLRSDLNITRELFFALEQDYAKPEAESLHRVRDITFRTCKALTRMYMSGICVDRTALQKVRHEFEQEKAEIEDRLQRKTRELMGDTPINLNSPEQVSQVIFSRKPLDKAEWVKVFEYDDSGDYKAVAHSKCKDKFHKIVASNTRVLKKTKAYTCHTCNGKGKKYKTRKDGTFYKIPNKCKDCDAKGYKLSETKETAGLMFNPPSKKWVSANGLVLVKTILKCLWLPLQATAWSLLLVFFLILSASLLSAVTLAASWMVSIYSPSPTDSYTSTLPKVSPVQVDFLDAIPTCRTCQEEEHSQ